MSFLADNIELVESAFGLACLLVCTILVFVKRTWPRGDIRLFARGFLGTLLLGDTYWAVFAFVFGHTPEYFYGGELAWWASELFLVLLVIEVYCQESKLPIHPAAWIGPVAVAALTVWFIVATGGALFNILMGFAMSGATLFSLSALFRFKKDRANGIERHFGLYLAVLSFVALEYTIWSLSVLDSSVSIANPYYWFSPVMYLTVIFTTAAILRLGKDGDGDDG